ncbi:MAG: hypothetical protein ACHQAX_00360 [Gammaproteobacteria bacterium]
MKRIFALSLSLSAVLMSEPVWAQEQVYCPQEVTCAQNGQASFCSFEQHERGYWNDSVASNYPGRYRLSYVSASYHSRDPSYAICVYTHRDVYQTLSLYAKPESNLERYDAAGWRQEESWWECKPSTSDSCPLFEQDALFVQNKTKYPIIVTPGAITVYPNQYTRLFADDFDDCANLEACTVELYTQDEHIGGLTVDLQHHLKIVDIYSNIDVASDIIKMGEFNAVEVK